jgi:hypothetical protein
MVWLRIGIGHGFDYDFGLELHMDYIRIGYGFDYNWFRIAIQLVWTKTRIV